MIKVLARTNGSSVYVFAVNVSSGGVKAELHIPVLGDRGATFYYGGGHVQSHQGRIIDAFPPLGVRIYVQHAAG